MLSWLTQKISMFRKLNINAIKEGASSVCKSSPAVAYSTSAVSGATSYNWTASGGATIASGQGTTNVTVNFTTCVSTSSTISVTANNACGASTARMKTVSVNLNCRIADNEIIQTGTTKNTISELAAYPNPTHGKITLSFNSNQNARYLLRIVDVIGNVLISKDLTVFEGVYSREIDLENVSAGLYFISIQSEGSETQTLRIVVE